MATAEKKLEDYTRDELIALVKKQAAEIQELNAKLVDQSNEHYELKRFAAYVRSLKTQKDFLHLRNVVLNVNKSQKKWKK